VCYQLLLCCEFFFCQFVFEVTLNCTVSVCASYCYRVAFPVVTERLPTINFFWPINISIDRGSLRY
jgi:hypothetical protein